MGNDNNHPDLVSGRNVYNLLHFRSIKNTGDHLIMSMSQQLVKSHHAPFLITPQTITEAMEYAKMISNSSFCPKGMQGKPGDVIIAIQMGAEVGLSPIQALQNIAVISGRPCIWGDASLALVQASQHYVSHREWEEVTDQGLKAFCAITRKGSEEYVKSFSEADAKKAGLWNKAGTWVQYPSRMLQMRARSFALRDKFADVLKGLSIREEIEDYQDFQEAPRSKIVPIASKQTIKIKVVPVEYDHDEFMAAVEEINNCKNETELKTIFTAAYKNQKIACNMKSKNALIKAKDEKKLQLGQEEFLNDYDSSTGELAQASEEAPS